MPNVKPYYTTDELLESIQLRIAFPLQQSTFNATNLIKFINEELQLSAVPTLLELHQEYLIYNKFVPLVPSLSNYPIPDRAIGMTLRDVKFMDTNGNLYDMARVAPEDKAFFQAGAISTQTYGLYYLQNNNVVLTPINPSNNSGYLRMDFAMRPNYLVQNDRACTIVAYHKYVTIDNYADLQAGDTFSFTIGNNTQTPTSFTFTAVSGSPGAYEFQIGGSNNATAANFVAAINAASIPDITAVVNPSDLQTADIRYDDITTVFVSETQETTNTIFDFTMDTTSIEFNQLPANWTNIDTNITESLYTADCLVDFLQTGSGHRTYSYDVTLLSLDGNIGTFTTRELQFQTFNVNASASYIYYPINVGDYMCLQNECIIPQIPSELHSALAERVAARIQRAIGDREGYAVSKAEIAEMDRKQNTMIMQRVEGSVNKVFNRSSLLRMGRFRWGRRF